MHKALDSIAASSDSWGSVRSVEKGEFCLRQDDLF